MEPPAEFPNPYVLDVNRVPKPLRLGREQSQGRGTRELIPARKFIAIAMAMARTDEEDVGGFCGKVC